jgi:hypothetical protein
MVPFWVDAVAFVLGCIFFVIPQILLQVAAQEDLQDTFHMSASMPEPSGSKFRLQQDMAAINEAASWRPPLWMWISRYGGALLALIALLSFVFGIVHLLR